MSGHRALAAPWRRDCAPHRRARRNRACAPGAFVPNGQTNEPFRPVVTPLQEGLSSPLTSPPPANRNGSAGDLLTCLVTAVHTHSSRPISTTWTTAPCIWASR